MMLNLDALTDRLSDWSSQFRQNHPTLESTPIALYQALFALVHNLKSSVQLSDDAQIKGLVDTVGRTESLLRKLAYDEVELEASRDAGLYKLSCALDALETLEVYLQTALPTAVPSPPCTHPLLALHYPWESLSRARASSCARHDYLFFQGSKRLTLQELSLYDRAIQEELRPHGGIDIVRLLTPHGSATGSDLRLEIQQIIAIPKAITSSAPPRTILTWHPLL